jgi:hypothetical protein
MKKQLIYILLTCFVVLYAQANAAQAAKADSTKKEEPKKKWYETLSIRGYAQVRYNRLLETNKKLKCEQCDKSIGDNGGFFIRRARLVFSGYVHDKVYIYIQPDFASAPLSTQMNFVQIRDAYVDVAIDNKKEFRFRVGQSKVPYGFDNLQSSQNRLAFDRSDAINSGTANERDIGVNFFWAPSAIRDRFKKLVEDGLKGTGDYGVVALGVYNGQTANKPELNNRPHVVARVSYPFMFKNGQFIEAGISGYYGEYNIPTDQRNSATLGASRFLDKRVAASVILYPQPFGFQAEYTMGYGPRFNTFTSTIDADKSLQGGYVQLMYMIKAGKQLITPYARSQYYDGGKKHEMDARSYIVREHEFGVEWQPWKYVELTAAYTISDRTFEDQKNPDNNQKGNFLRLQLQFNY